MSVVNGVVVALPPPEGYVVDFDNPQRRYVVAVYVVSGLGMLFSFVFMLQRLFVKIYVHHSLRLDDCKLNTPARYSDLSILGILTICTRLCHLSMGKTVS